MAQSGYVNDAALRRPACIDIQVDSRAASEGRKISPDG